jgi:hypothetical protein
MRRLFSPPEMLDPRDGATINQEFFRPRAKSGGAVGAAAGVRGGGGGTAAPAAAAAAVAAAREPTEPMGS